MNLKWIKEHSLFSSNSSQTDVVEQIHADVYSAQEALFCRGRKGIIKAGIISARQRVKTARAGCTWIQWTKRS